MTEVVLEIQHPSLYVYQIPSLSPFSNNAHCFVMRICVPIRPLHSSKTGSLYASAKGGLVSSNLYKWSSASIISSESRVMTALCQVPAEGDGFYMTILNKQSRIAYEAVSCLGVGRRVISPSS
jgi:hypothetical protein